MTPSTSFCTLPARIVDVSLTALRRVRPGTCGMAAASPFSALPLLLWAGLQHGQTCVADALATSLRSAALALLVALLAAAACRILLAAQAAAGGRGVWALCDAGSAQRAALFVRGYVDGMLVKTALLGTLAVASVSGCGVAAWPLAAGAAVVALLTLRALRRRQAV